LPHTLGGQPFRHPDAIDGNLRHTLQVLALDAGTGRIVWTKTAYEGPVYDDRHRRSSYAPHTPVTDGALVYAYFGSEGLYAYRLDGTLAWSKMLGKIAGASVGLGTSPVLHGNLIIVQADEDEGAGSFIAALDKTTGADVWRTPRKTGITWSTPIVATAGGRAQLITTANEQTIAYDPVTGTELWRDKGLENNAIPSPVLAGNLVIVSTGYPGKRTMALRLDDPGEGSRIVWQYDKGTAYVVSPIVYGNYLYLTTDNGILTCLDVRTGAVQYEGGRPPVPATFMASPVAYRDHVFMTSTDGQTFAIQAGPTFEVTGTNSVDEPVWASPALANGTVYIRGERHLFAIRAQ
jgi:outer membrane protein assembly factor BamB